MRKKEMSSKGLKCESYFMLNFSCRGINYAITQARVNKKNYFVTWKINDYNAEGVEPIGFTRNMREARREAHLDAFISESSF